MKKGIHPDYRDVVFHDLSSDYKFLTRSTVQTKDTIEFEGQTYPLVKIEVSSQSHPFYTGKNVLLDTAGRVDKFRKRYGTKETATPIAARRSCRQGVGFIESTKNSPVTLVVAGEFFCFTARCCGMLISRHKVAELWALKLIPKAFIYLTPGIPTSMKKILIIEDDRRIAQNISRGLQEEGYATEVVYEGLNGRLLALQPGIDLLILDINLPGLSGFEVCRSVRAGKPQLPIIMLTALGEIEDKVEGLALGADDYLVKPFDFRELVARVATCFRRSALATEPVVEEVWQVANLTVNFTTKDVRRDNTLIDLTAREFALLEYLMRNRGRVLSKMDIAETVWNLHFDPGTNVVEVYVNYLRKKIDRDFMPKLIHNRPGMGYVLKEE